MPSLIAALIVSSGSSILSQTGRCSCCRSLLSVRSWPTSCHRIGISKQLLHLESSMEQKLVVLDWRSHRSIDAIFAFIGVQVHLLIPLNVYCNLSILHLNTHFIAYCRAGNIPKHSLPTPGRIRHHPMVPSQIGWSGSSLPWTSLPWNRIHSTTVNCSQTSFQNENKLHPESFSSYLLNDSPFL